MQGAAESTTSCMAGIGIGGHTNNNTSVARRKDLPQLWIFGAKGRKMGDRPDKLGVRYRAREATSCMTSCVASSLHVDGTFLPHPLLQPSHNPKHCRQIEMLLIYTILVCTVIECKGVSPHLANPTQKATSTATSKQGCWMDGRWILLLLFAIGYYFLVIDNRRYYPLTLRRIII